MPEDKSVRADDVAVSVEQPLDFDEAVSILAYQLWEEAGCPDGRSDEFWHAAVARLNEDSPS